MPARDGWDPRRLPDQSGKVFLITGGNRGIGYFAAEQLAGAGARVVIAARDRARSRRAIAAIEARVEGAELDFLQLDLADPASVRAAGREVARWERLDGVAANGAITMGSPKRQVTPEGIELTFATNHLGHFLLASFIWLALANTPGSRWVSMSSLSTALVPAEVDDLNSERRYDGFRAYALSKHAALGFAAELDRRLRVAGASWIALAAHPGWAVDGLTAARAGVTPRPAAWERGLAAVAQGKNHGAMPLVRALTDPAAQGGELFAPAAGLRGAPVPRRLRAPSARPEFGRELWRLSELWCGVAFRP